MDYPPSIVPVNHVAPVPRRIRAYVGAEKVLDTTRALYVWEWPHYPQYYIPLDDVRRDRWVPSDTVPSCPYKGMTSGYWSALVGGTVHKDLAWAYDFPTRQLLPIAGLVAFYNEMVDTYIDGERLDRPQTHFSRTGRDGS